MTNGNHYRNSPTGIDPISDLRVTQTQTRIQFHLPLCKISNDYLHCYSSDSLEPTDVDDSLRSTIRRMDIRKLTTLNQTNLQPN